MSWITIPSGVEKPAFYFAIFDSNIFESLVQNFCTYIDTVNEQTLRDFKAR